MNHTKMNILDFLNLTKSKIDEGGDGTEYKVVDQEAMTSRLSDFAEVASQMRPQMPAAPQGLQMPQGQVNPMPQMQQPAVNPYAPVNYGTMSQQPQMGGIGSAPSMEQILRALQSQQR